MYRLASNDRIRQRRRTTQWNIFFHYFAIGYTIVSGVVLVPLYLNFVTVDLYGVWLATSNVIIWMSVIDPGLSGVLMQKVSVAYGRRDLIAINSLLTNGVVLSVLVACIVLGAGWFVSPHLFYLLNIDDTGGYTQVPTVFLTAVVGTALMVFSYGITAINQGLQSSLGVGLIFALTQTASLAFTVWLLYEGWGLMALALSFVFRGAGLIVGNLVYLIWRIVTDGIRFKPSFYGFQEITRLMSFTFMGKAVGTVATNLDAMIITRNLGPELAAVFMLTRKIPEIGRTFLERPALAFMPAVSSLWGVGDVIRVRAVLMRLLRIMLWCTGLVGVGVFLLNGVFIKLWVGDALYAGTLVNGLIVNQLIVLVFATTLSSLCYALGNIKGNSIAMMVQGLVSIPFMILGARYLGLVGVALAPLVATLLVSMVYFPRVFSRLLQLGYQEIQVYLYEVVRVCVAAIVTALVFSRWNEPIQWGQFTVIVLILSVFYTLVLLAVSPAFRQECLVILRRALPAAYK